MKLRLALVSTLALAGALGAGVAQARDADVRWSVTIGSPGYGHASPGPVYLPGPVYVPAPVYRAPRPVMVHPQPVYYRAPTHWDRDGDGIPNRQDRLYNPAWDRDGDGIPNRHERRHDKPYRDHDRDGVPNRWDRNDNNPYRR